MFNDKDYDQHITYIAPIYIGKTPINSTSSDSKDIKTNQYIEITYTMYLK